MRDNRTSSVARTEVVRLADLVNAIPGALPKTPQDPGPERKILAHLRDAAATARILAKSLGKREPAVRVDIGRLKDALERFFRDTPPGRRCLYRLDVIQEPELQHGEHRYALAAYRNPYPVDQFWSAHHTGGETVIVWAEPLFFYERASRSFVRFLDVNSDSLDPTEVYKDIAPDHASRKMTPAFHYQSSGDIAAVYQLERSIDALGIRGRRAVIREMPQKTLIGVNAIVVGNRRMNRYVELFQRAYDFTVEAGSVRIANPVAARGERAEYVDYEPAHEQSSSVPSRAYAVLTRRPNFTEHKSVTMIAGNHGRSIEKVAEYITSDASMERLWDKVSSLHAGWPSSFQVLFEIAVSMLPDMVVFQEPIPVAFREYGARQV